MTVIYHRLRWHRGKWILADCRLDQARVVEDQIGHEATKVEIVIELGRCHLVKAVDSQGKQTTS